MSNFLQSISKITNSEINALSAFHRLVELKSNASYSAQIKAHARYVNACLDEYQERGVTTERLAGKSYDVVTFFRDERNAAENAAKVIAAEN